MQKLTMGRFYVQTGITFAAVVVCVFKLLTSGAQDSSTYWTGLIGVLAYWMPAPNTQVESKKDRELDLYVGSIDRNEVNINPAPNPSLNSASRN